MSSGPKFYGEKNKNKAGKRNRAYREEKGWLGKTTLKRWHLRQDLELKGQAGRYPRKEFQTRKQQVQGAANRPACLELRDKFGSAEELRKSRRALETTINKDLKWDSKNNRKPSEHFELTSEMVWHSFSRVYSECYNEKRLLGVGRTGEEGWGTKQTKSPALNYLTFQQLEAGTSQPYKALFKTLVIELHNIYNLLKADFMDTCPNNNQLISRCLQQT